MAVDNHTLLDFRAQIKDLQRKNLFKAEIILPQALQGSIPNAEEGQTKFSFMCRSVAAPTMEIEPLIVDFGGMQVPLAGDRIVSDWECTILNDTDWVSRDVLEAWNDFIIGSVEQDAIGDATTPLDYVGTGVIQALTRNKM